VSQDDVERLRKGYADFNSGDFAAVFELLDNEFVVRDRDEVPDPQVYQGIEGARRVFAVVGDGFEEYSIEPVEFADGDGWVVVAAVQRGRGELSGAVVEGNIFHLWRLREGLATELRAFSTKKDALAAARDPGWPSS
jgi:ketosteroid isomerase-like protein